MNLNGTTQNHGMSTVTEAQETVSTDRLQTGEGQVEEKQALPPQAYSNPDEYRRLWRKQLTGEEFGHRSPTTQTDVGRRLLATQDAAGFRRAEEEQRLKDLVEKPSVEESEVQQRLEGYVDPAQYRGQWRKDLQQQAAQTPEDPELAASLETFSDPGKYTYNWYELLVSMKSTPKGG